MPVQLTPTKFTHYWHHCWHRFWQRCWLLLAILALPAMGQQPSVAEIIETANLNAFYAGIDGRAEARMTIVDRQGRKQLRQFTLLRKDLQDAGDQDLLVFFSRPADVRGTAYRVARHIQQDDDRWLYLPALDLLKRVAAGDKRTSFVGSHFYYEDVSGRNIHEDNFRLLETTAQHFILEATPKDPGSVEFASYRLWIDKGHYLPVKIEYTDPRGRLYRRVESLQIEDRQGHATVLKAKASDLLNGGHTLLQFRRIRYDLGLPQSLFSERSLRKAPAKWLASR